MKLVLLIIFIYTLGIAENIDLTNKKFVEKKDLYENIISNATTYKNMNLSEKEKFKKDIDKLLDIDYLSEILINQPNKTKETIIKFSPYINVYAYFYAKEYPKKENLNVSLMLMTAVIKYNSNDAYLETYALVLARQNKFDFPLNFFPKFLDKYEYKDSENDFDIVKDLAINYAIVNNNIDLLKKLLELNVDLNYFKEKNSIPPIFLALSDVRFEKSARFLIDNGIDKNIMYKNKNIIEFAKENNFKEEFILYIKN